MSQRVPKEFIKNLQGKDFVLLGGLLELAHQDGLNHTSTEILQFPTQENGNTTIIRAVVRTGKGEFSGIGDASPASVPNKAIAVHSIRMAETRAIARALRVATNVSMTAFEELGEMSADESHDTTTTQPQPAAPASQKTGYVPRPKQAAAPQAAAAPAPVDLVALTKKRLWDLARTKGMDQEGLSAFARRNAYKGLEDCTVLELEQLLDQLKAA